MHKLSLVAVALLALCPAALAQLTTDQKVSDFTQLAALYARNYGPYDAKVELYGFDLYVTKPWLDQVRASKTDLEFYDICTKYVASLRDSHASFSIRASYEPYLPITVDIYDGKVLIDGITRSLLPLAKFPFRTGDELLSIDGKSMADWIKDLDPYTVNGASNAVSRARIAANLALDRYQGWWITSPLSLGDRKTATLEVKRQSTGATETYVIDWQILGVPIMGEGPIPPLPKADKSNRAAQTAKALRAKGDVADSRDPNPWGAGKLPAEEVPNETVPELLVAHRMATESLPLVTEGGGIVPFGATSPAFNPPANFRLRLGSRSSDFFLSGTFAVGARNVGFIRIPTFSPSSTAAAFAQFINEIVYLQANTDGLVIDVMANGGGSGCYAQNLVTALSPQAFRGLAYQIRPTQFWLNVFGNSLINAQLNNAPQYVQVLYAEYLRQIQVAYAENRGVTGAIPVCGVSFDVPPAQDSAGAVVAYTKPILVLTDNFTLSSAEIFTMMLQDEKRATVFGTVTDGGGGNVNSFNAGAFSEGQARITQSLITRKSPVAPPGYPSLYYYDGVGIYPDIQGDYMTRENFLTFGAPFVSQFSAAIAALIDKK